MSLTWFVLSFRKAENTVLESPNDLVSIRVASGAEVSKRQNSSRRHTRSKVAW